MLTSQRLEEVAHAFMFREQASLRELLARFGEMTTSTGSAKGHISR